MKMKRSISRDDYSIQKEAASLQRELQALLNTQNPFSEDDVKRLRDGAGNISSAQAGMLLLKTRVFIKGIKRLDSRMHPLSKKIEEEIGSIQKNSDRAAEKKQSLEISRVILLELQAQSRSLIETCTSLEQALVDIDKAAAQGKKIQLLQAYDNARRLCAGDHQAAH